MRRRLADRLQYVRECRYVSVGPLLITTRSGHKALERDAFEIGAECQRMGLVKGKTAAS